MTFRRIVRLTPAVVPEMPTRAAPAAITLSPRGVAVALASLIAAAYLAGTAVQIAVFAGGYLVPDNVVRLVDLNRENNLPTWLSSTNLLIGALVTAVIARAKQAQRDPYTRYWFGLCLAFLYLSVDEAASLHELPTNRLRELVGTGGAFYAAWVIPAMLAVAVFVLLYLRFYVSLPRRMQGLLALAAGLYVGGAIGFEMVSWHYRAPMFDPMLHLESRDLTYLMIAHVEELFEMLGVAVAIYALLSYIGTQGIRVSLSVSRAGREAGGA